MFSIDSNNTIHLTRGDSASIAITINNELTHSAYEMAETDILKMTVRKSLTSPILFQKTVHGSNTIKIEPTDTEDFKFANYLYDVELSTVDGDVYTIITPSTIEICPEVTY